MIRKSGSTDPTHSQLAKDHDTHPLHVLAAKLARSAVGAVGNAMGLRWSGSSTIDPAKVAADFLVHPFDTAWQDETVRSWAAEHPKEITRAGSATEWEALDKEHKQEALDAIKAVGSPSMAAWDYIHRNTDAIFGASKEQRK